VLEEHVQYSQQQRRAVGCVGVVAIRRRTGILVAFESRRWWRQKKRTSETTKATTTRAVTAVITADGKRGDVGSRHCGIVVAVIVHSLPISTMHRSFSFNFFPPSFLSSAAADQNDS
jgi:hypothetical protein